MITRCLPPHIQFLRSCKNCCHCKVPPQMWWCVGKSANRCGDMRRKERKKRAAALIVSAPKMKRAPGPLLSSCSNHLNWSKVFVVQATIADKVISDFFAEIFELKDEALLTTGVPVCNPKTFRLRVDVESASGAPLAVVPGRRSCLDVTPLRRFFWCNAVASYQKSGVDRSLLPNWTSKKHSTRRSTRPSAMRCCPREYHRITWPS